VAPSGPARPLLLVLAAAQSARATLLDPLGGQRLKGKERKTRKTMEKKA
jgi:hypothetical protein